ncbi:MAG: sugar phosphate isomerase/epimerase [Lentisphaerae bacterium]|nr:sugar phosphate isomerase/epimerase [Lentisphaerota bacterium]
MKICMMSLMMSDMVGCGYSIDEILETAVKCGMGAIDWIGLHHTTSVELKRASDAHGVPIAAHTMLKEGFIHDDPAYFDEFKSSLEDAVIMNAPVLMLPPFARINQTSMADDRSRYLDYYGNALELAQKAGVTLTLESTGYINSPITTADECLELLRQLPGLKLTFDQGNVATAEDPCGAFLKLRDYVVHFHVKDWHVSTTAQADYTPKRNGLYFRDALLGEGDMPIGDFWQLTNDAERQLWVNPESCDFTGKRPVLEVFQEICNEMRSWE